MKIWIRSLYQIAEAVVLEVRHGVDWAVGPVTPLDEVGPIVDSTLCIRKG